MNRYSLLTAMLLSLLVNAMMGQESRTTFENMLSRHDAQIVDRLKNDAYVCFVSTDNRFLIISWDTPRQWVLDKYGLRSKGRFGLIFFQDGIEHQQLSSNPYINWTNLDTARQFDPHGSDTYGWISYEIDQNPPPPSSQTFYSNCSTWEVTICSVNVNDSRIELIESTMGGKHFLNIRRSTGMFVEEIDGRKYKGHCDLYHDEVRVQQ